MSEFDQNDALAAEYVLGTLDSHERALARTLLTDEAFAAKVRLWERRLGELHLMVEPVEPDAKIWPRIKGRMYEPPLDPNARLPEPENLELPAAQTATPAAGPPSLEAIEAVISDAAMTLNAEASPAQKSEQVPERPPDAGVTATSESIPTPIEEEMAPPPASEPAPAIAPEPSSEAAAPPPLSEPDSEPRVTPSSEPSLEPGAAAPSELPSEPGLPPPLESPAIPPAETTAEPAETSVAEPVQAAVVDAAEAPPEPSAVEPPVALPPAPSIPAPTPPPPVVAPPPVLGERLAAPVEPQRAIMRVDRRLRRWRAFALLLTLVVATLAALLAAWRFAPDRVPPPLRPLALMRHFGVTPPVPPQLPRRQLPPGSQYDE